MTRPSILALSTVGRGGGGRAVGMDDRSGTGEEGCDAWMLGRSATQNRLGWKTAFTMD